LLYVFVVLKRLFCCYATTTAATTAAMQTTTTSAYLLQSSVQNAVTMASQLLFFNPARFSIPTMSHASLSHPRLALSAQFSEIAPR